MLQKISIVYKVLSVTLIVLTLPFQLFSINYTITFTGSGASTTLDNVIVENLTKGTTTTVPAGNSLYLTDVTTSIENINSGVSDISVYPNPIIDNSTISFQAKSTGHATIKVFSLEGKCLISAKNEFGVGSNSFQLSLPKGTYLIQIAANDYTYTTKAISKSNSKTSISFAANENTIKSKPQKVKSGLTTMLYSDGDQLLYRGKSGNYTAIVTDRPATSKTTNFDFVECKDADGNYYATVKIGSQIWMAENLKTTKYNDNVSIPNVTDNATWSTLSTGAYCDYNNTPANSAIYGKLYNWHTVNTGKLAPIGWQMPNNNDWTILYDFLDRKDAANKMRTKLAGGTNSSGFSILPAGYRYHHTGNFSGINVADTWMTFWSAEAFDNTSSWGLGTSLSNGESSAVKSILFKESGYPIRCIKN